MSSINPMLGMGMSPYTSGINSSSRLLNTGNTGGYSPNPQFDSYGSSNNPFSFDQSSYGDISSLIGSIVQLLQGILSGGGYNPEGMTNGDTMTPDSQQPPQYGQPTENTGGYTPTEGAANDKSANNDKSKDVPPAPEASADAESQDGATMDAQIDGGGPNQVKLKNNSDKPMKVAFMKNPTPENPESKPQFVEIPAGQNLDAALPEGWAGRFYKVNESGAQESTLGEVNFEKGKTWYDVSAIDGYNGAMTIDPTNSGSSGNAGTAGSSEDIRNGAPEGLLKKGPNGETVLVSTDPIGDNGSNQEAVGYLRDSLGGTGSTYTNPIDDREKDSPMRDTSDNSLTVNLY